MNKEHITQLLPWIMRKHLTENSPLDTIITIMAEYINPVNESYNNLGDFFNPLLTSVDMVYYMACWFNVEWIFGKGTYGLISSNTKEGRDALQKLRRVISDIEMIIWWKGTSKGLKILLERVLDISEIEIINQDYHFVLRINRDDNIDLDLLSSVVEHEKAVAMTWSLELV